MTPPPPLSISMLVAQVLHSRWWAFCTKHSCLQLRALLPVTSATKEDGASPPGSSTWPSLSHDAIATAGSVTRASF